MSEHEIINPVEGVTKAVLESEPIKNVTGPATKSLGIVLGDIFDLCFCKIHEKAEIRRIQTRKNVEDFEKSIYNESQKIPKENLIEPKISIVGPAIEASKYYYEEKEIRNMFEKLIVNSMDNRKIDNIHPSFTEIIKQLSPLDAQNLKCFIKKPNLPICEYRVIKGNSDHFRTVLTNIFLENLQCQNLKQQSISISSLSRLELVKVDYISYLSDNLKYKKFEKTPFFLDLSKNLNYKTNLADKVEIHKGQVSVTPFGSAFLKICLSPLTNL